MTVLSDVDRRMPRVWHPWRAIRERADITVKWEPIPGRLGQWCQRTMTMTLHPEQSQRQRRCTATHELIHAERGHCGACSPAVDRAVHAEAARRLISLDELVDALLWSQDEQELAEELWVDVATVMSRLEGLTEYERAEIDRRLDEREWAA
jgi:hypothetical protein